jgi:hypothetical protein
MDHDETRPEDVRCPICGEGVVTDIAYDDDSPAEGDVPFQEAESRQLITYSCGHKAPGPRLSTADAERLDVERRQTDELEGIDATEAGQHTPNADQP